MQKLHQLWSGTLPLGEAFWTYAVIGGLLINLSTSLAFLALLAADRPIAALLVGYALSVPYNVLVTVGVWRAAGRHVGDPRWASLARVATVLGMILLSLT